MYQPVKPRRDADGEVIIAQPNCKVPGFKKGKGEDVYFQRSTYIATGNPFKVAALGSMSRTVVKDGHLKAGHDVAFKPSKTVIHERQKQ